MQLPEPAQCFGEAEAPYGAKERDFIIELLENDKSQTIPWPSSLQSTFSSLSSSSSERPLYGSPMLDGALGQVGSVGKVLALLKSSRGSTAKGRGKGSASSRNSGGGGSGKKKKFEGVQQLDSILPPEAPTSWVQCEACHKWRRVAWHIDSATLPDNWVCSLNTWDLDSASCEVPQDTYNPDIESTVQTNAVSSKADAGNLSVGDWRDVFCKTNKIYYEAQVKKLKRGNAGKTKDKAQFHFLGWSACFDEWIEVDSDRIQPHNFHTSPDTHDPREQEKWQGLLGIGTVIRTAFRKESKKQLQFSEKPKTKRRHLSEEPVTSAIALSGATLKGYKMPCLSPMTVTTEESHPSSGMDAQSY